MNTKLLKQIGFMALGAMVVRGAGGLFPATANQKLVHGGLAGASGLGAMKATNPNLQSALIGATVIKALDFGKAIIETSPTAQTLASKTDKASAFLRSATGLGCPCDEGLGYADEEMAYLNGAKEMYVDQDGNVIGLGYADEEMAYLNGAEEMYVDEAGNVVGLGVANEEDAYLNGAEQDELSVL